MGLRRLTETQQRTAEAMARGKLAGDQGRTSVISDVRTWLQVSCNFLSRPALERARMVVKKVEGDMRTWNVVEEDT